MPYEGIGPQQGNFGDGDEQPVCRYYTKRGWCGRKNCQFKHCYIEKEWVPYAGNPEKFDEPCKQFINKGWCSRPACRYIHDHNLDPYRQMHIPPEELTKVHKKPKKVKKDKSLPTESVIDRLLREKSEQAVKAKNDDDDDDDDIQVLSHTKPSTSTSSGSMPIKIALKSVVGSKRKTIEQLVAEEANKVPKLDKKESKNEKSDTKKKDSSIKPSGGCTFFAKYYLSTAKKPDDDIKFL